MTAIFEKNNTELLSPQIEKNKGKERRPYSKREWGIIILTCLVVLLGFLLRTWRIIREGAPITFDGYYYLRYIKQDFFRGWMDLTKITRDPPGFTFLIIFASHLLGLEVAPMTWAIHIFPQIVCTIQLVIFFVLARRLSKSRTIGLLATLYMAIIGLYVYRNQNIAPETMVLGLVPFVIFYILRYFESKDIRFLLLAWAISFAIIMVHHLTALIVIIIWHVIIPYDFIYRLVKKEKNKKGFLINFLFLIGMDILIVIVWVVLLKSFPISFIKEVIVNSFPEGEPITTIVIMFVAAVLIVGLVFTIFFYNFENKKINNTVSIVAIIGVVAVFVVAMFFGASSPDQTVLSGLAMGSSAFVLGPLGFIGINKIEKINEPEGRVLRGWFFSTILLICGVAVFPLLSSLLARLAFFVIPLGVILATYAIAHFTKKGKTRKIKALVLISLTGFMALTLSYSHPKPENNWNIQEVYWDAEFATMDYLILYGNAPNNTIWHDNTGPQVDCDFRIAALVEGITGFEATFEENGTSWLREIVFMNKSLLEDFVANSSIKILNPKIKYIIINDVLMNSGYHLGWIVYGEDNDNLITKFPDISQFLPLNPNINRIMDNKITLMLIAIN